MTWNEHQEEPRVIHPDMLSRALQEGYTLTCAAECDHGCGLAIAPDTNTIRQATAAGWVVVLWETDLGTTDHNAHMVAFCDPGCHYTWLRARMLADSHWLEHVTAMDSAAEDKATVWNLMGMFERPDGHQH